MHRAHVTASVIFGVAAVALTAWVCVADPILSDDTEPPAAGDPPGERAPSEDPGVLDEPDLSDEIRSLSGIKTFRVTLKVVPFAPMPADFRYPVGRMKGRIEKMVVDRGFVISERQADATIAVVVQLRPDPEHPDAVCCLFHTSIEQDVTVKRTRRGFHVPTYALVHGIMAQRNEVRKQVKRYLEIQVHFTLDRINLANKSARSLR